MHPVIWDLGFEIGDFPVRMYTYGLCMSVALFAFLAVFLEKARRYANPIDLYLMVLVVFLAGILGSKILYIVANHEYYAGLDPEVIPIGGNEIRLPPFRAYLASGMVWYGGVLLALPTGIAFAIWRKLGFLRMFDFVVPGISIGHLWGRIGCFMAGCCYGDPTDLPWGVRFPEGSVAHAEMLEERMLPPGATETMPLHPTQLYESVAELVIFGILVGYGPYKKFNGQVAGLYMGLYAVFRFVVEFARGDASRGGLLGISTSQWIAIALFTLGLVLFTWGWVVRRRRPAPVDPAAGPGEEA